MKPHIIEPHWLERYERDQDERDAELDYWRKVTAPPTDEDDEYGE